MSEWGFLDEAIARLGALLLAGLNRSARYSLTCEPGVKEALQKPCIIAFWHGQQLMMPFVWRRVHGKKVPIWALISQHRDGRRVARAMSFVGISSVAGSSTRGGARAFRELVRVLRGGNHIAITPDGPKGPRLVPKQGAVDLARLTEAPLILMAVAFKKSWRFRSWDQMEVPKPGTKISAVVSTLSPVDLTAENLAAELNRITAKAEQGLHGT